MAFERETISGISWRLWPAPKHEHGTFRVKENYNVWGFFNTHKYQLIETWNTYLDANLFMETLNKHR